MDTAQLESRIISHEGYRKFTYEDSLGFETIGIGRCIDSRKGKGLSMNEALYLLKNDIDECSHQLAFYPWYKIHDDVRKCALIELCFNLGIRGLTGFKKMLACLLEKDYSGAAKELLDSRWAKQVGEIRSKDIANRLEHGCY